MRLTYNGIEIQILELKSCHREPVYDGPKKYLYTVWKIHVRGIYNPRATAYTFNATAINRANPAGPVGIPEAPLTDAVIRDRLMAPGRRLTWSVGPTTLLDVPRGVGATANAGAPQQVASPALASLPATDLRYSDAANGPLPLSCDVAAIMGPKTFAVDFQIQAHVNEGFFFRSDGTARTVLSHSWTMREDIDQDFYTVRTIQGHAIFNVERLREQSAVPDDFRAFLFHPIPPNFQRVSVNVVAADDGTALAYTLVDRERALNLGTVFRAVNATRIEATYTQRRSRPGFDSVAFATAIHVAKGNAAVGFGVVDAIFGGNPIGGAVNVGKTISDFGITTVELAAQLAPRTTHQVIVRIWGNRNSDRNTLQFLAYRLAVDRLTQTMVRFGLQVADTALEVTHDLVGTFIELRLQAQTGPIEGLAEATVNPLFLVPNPFLGLHESPGFLLRPTVINPHPPNNNARGTFVGSLAAQVLTGGFQTTPTVGALPNPRPPLNLGAQ